MTFDLDANGILKVSARDLGTGRAQEIVISSSSNLSEADIQQAMADAAQYAAEDKAKKAFMELRNEAETLIVQCKNALTVCGKELEKGERKLVQNDLSALERIFQKAKPEKRKPGDEENLRSAMEQLKGSAGDLLSRYAQRAEEEARQEE